MLLVKGARVVGGEDDAEALGHGPSEVEAGAREDLVAELVAVGVGRLAQVEVLVVADQVERVTQLAAAALEGALAHEVDRAREGVGRVGGGGDLGNLHPRDVVEGHRAHVDRARGGGPDVGGGRAVVGDGGHPAADAADGDARDVGQVALHGYAGEELHKLADGAAEDVAERVRREHIFDVRGEALLVGRDCLGVGLALLGDDECVEAHGGVAGLAVAGDRGEVEILLHAAAGGHEHLGGGGIESGKEDLQCRRSGRQLGQAVTTVLVGEGRRAGAADGHAGVG